MIPIVVSGATGLLGKSILDKLLTVFPNTQIIALARTPIKNKNITTILWDLPNQLPNKNQLPEKFHYIHTANLLKTTDTSKFESINCKALEEFLSIFTEQISSIIWVSSLSVLGSGPFISATETDLTMPNTELAKSRLKQEELILKFAKKNNIPCTGLRGRLYIGANEKEFNSYLRLILKYPLLAFNNAETKISVISSEDFASIVSKIILKNSSQREIYNIAYSTPLSIKEFLKTNNKKPILTISTKMISYLIVFMPKKIRISLTNKIELLGQNQVMNVTKLNQFLNDESLDKNPIEIINSYIKTK
jgi:nucleoside-diphosphate-sugar epimerase